MLSAAPLALLLFIHGALGVTAGAYYGASVGALSQLHHGVRGNVYAVDSRTLYLRDLHYDGEGPAAYFYVGRGKAPSSKDGVRLRDERGGAGPLRKYRGESLTLSLPDGLTVNDIAWFSIWCDEFSVNFGDVRIPRDLAVPRPVRLEGLRGAHGVRSDPIVVVDAQTLLIPHFSYDGEAPDAKFWVGRGSKPSPQGVRIPDESGRETPLGRYDRKTIVLTLPGDLTVFDIGHVGVWCEAFTVDFGHVQLPRAQLASVPPSLRMLGVSPQSKLNCEVLLEEAAFEVRWAVAGDSIVFQLVARLEKGEYMSFGISGAPDRSQMVGGDVVVAWVNQTTLQGRADDYYLDAKSQCAGVSGSCPDRVLAAGTDSIRLLNAALVNGYSIVTYQRSLRAADRLDLPVMTNASQPVIWAIGPRNGRDEVSYHHHYTKGDKFLEFGRPPVWNCPTPEGEDEHPAPAQLSQHMQNHKDHGPKIKPQAVPPPRAAPRVDPWEIPAIQCYEPPDGVFYAQMGPTGGKQGYPAITGHVGWGISWYINGLLIPEINVIRGKKYTFVVEGGHDPDTPAKYHPFYITNDPVGGYQHKTEAEKKGVEIYAGVRRSRSGELVPSGTGRLCNWTPDEQGPPADDYPSFGAYQRSLTLVCEEGDPGVVTWTPDKNTPDTVYYQCFTHRHLGWKINVLDECDEVEGDESQLVESRILPERSPDAEVHRPLATDNLLDRRPQVQKLTHNKYGNHFSGTSGRERDEGRRPYQEIELPLTDGQIDEVIQAVETIESDMKDRLRRNRTETPGQYEVHEDIKETYLPERPAVDGAEYVVDGRVPETFFLPPNQKPLTLQAVLRPHGPRPPYRRPAPPEIKLRRPPPPHRPPPGYPLPLPAHSPHMQKKPQKFPNGRIPPNMSRQPIGQPMKAPSSMYPKPVPHQVPPLKMGGTHGLAKPNNLGQSVIMGKPISGNLLFPPPADGQSLGAAQTDIIVNQVVQSQITLPANADPVAQHSAPQIYSRPGQIILGKPLERPAPLDQLMIQTKPQLSRTPPTPPPQLYPSTTLRIKLSDEHPSRNEIKSSDFIGESADPSAVQPAVNTGFKPDSIVVESGFKPIIREPLMAAEDRIADYGGNSNRREDTDVEEDYDESPQPVANHAYPSDRITETFEPMFIPSPPDRLLPTDDVTKEVFPENHAKEDRPHPVYVKTESELNALFGKNNMNRDVPDMMMESDRVSPHYLPPDPKLPKEHSQKLSSEQTFTTYDGKTVSAATLTSVPDVKTGSKLFSSRLPANTELLLKSPQFGPFKGEIPPPVADHIVEAKLSDLNPKTTKLKLVNIHKPTKTFLDDLKPDGSENDEVTVTPSPDYDAEKTQNETEDDYEEEEQTEELPKSRRKRDTKNAQFEKGEVEQVHTNGHTLVRNQVEFDEKPSTSSASRRLYSLTPIVLLTLRLNVF